MRILMVVLGALGGAGCATTLSTLQTARPVEPKHVQATVGTGLYVPLGSVISVVAQAVHHGDKGIKAVNAQEPYEFSEQEQQDLLTAGVALAVMPPSQGYEVSLRTGVVEDVDVGLRYSVNALRLDGKWRFLHRGDEPSDQPDRPSAQSAFAHRSFDGALGLGVSRYIFSNPVFEVLGWVKLDDFSRWDVEVPVIFSAEFGEVLKLYGAPKYVYSRTTMDEKLVRISAEASNITGLDLTLPARVDSHFIGATAGVGVGYKWVHLLLELTGGYTVCNPHLFGRVRPLGGATFYPAVALNVRI